ncbi:putative Dol-P-Man:Man(7)GlcNAc(2)-PP-Dol alpha-1,6-mannosyltransferase [Dirofilaria immitis]
MSRNKRLSEWLLVTLCVLHVIIAPYTKVEESFNIQAIHDILYHRFNFTKYDHREFPGVVPRTFMGAIAVSTPLFPVVNYFKCHNIGKLWILYCVRLLLGLTILFAFSQFAERIDKKFGGLSGDFLRLIVATQFHFMFYCSRPLPNTFALLGARIATVFILLFRCELTLLFGCIFIVPILTHQLPLFGWNGAIVQCLFVAVLTLGISVPIDSFLWGRKVWPEGEVWWFNVILNRSHEYGVLPYFWYFYSAIPRAMFASTPLVFLGALIDRRLLAILMPVVCYIFLYSFLPHKELRFIIYTLPLLNVSSAVFCARITSFFLLASSRNYPGGEALTYLQYLRHSDRNKPVSVHIDNYAAQTGASRFLQWYDAWEYNKTENLEVSHLARFDFLLIGSYMEPDIVNCTASNFFSTHHILYNVEAFQGVELRRMQWFPYYWPVTKFNAQLVVLEKLYYSK